MKIEKSRRLFERLRDLGIKLDKVPANFKTIEQWAKEWECSRSCAWRLIAHGVEVGAMVERRFRIKIGLKSAYKVRHYAEK